MYSAFGLPNLKSMTRVSVPSVITRSGRRSTTWPSASVCRMVHSLNTCQRSLYHSLTRASSSRLRIIAVSRSLVTSSLYRMPSDCICCRARGMSALVRMCENTSWSTLPILM